MTSGGPSRMRSPSRAVRAAGRGVDQRPVVRAGGDDLLGDPLGAGKRRPRFRSATSSTARSIPIPRMSPTAGCPASSARRAASSRAPCLSRGGTRSAFAQYPEHRQPGRGADRMVGVGEAVGEPAGTIVSCTVAGAGREPERPVAGRAPLAPTTMSGRTSQCSQANHRAGPPEPGHHLVGDQQHAVPAADPDDGRPVVVRWDAGAQRGARDRLGDERRHLARARRPGWCARARRRAGRRSPTGWVSGNGQRYSYGVLVCRRRPEPGQVRRAQAGPARRVQGAASVAVVRAPPGHHARAGPPLGPGGRRGPSSARSRPPRCRRRPGRPGRRPAAARPPARPRTPRPTAVVNAVPWTYAIRPGLLRDRVDHLGDAVPDPDHDRRRRSRPGSAGRRRRRPRRRSR